MAEKRNAYYRKRRVAAAELERLQAEGQRVHEDALEWARLTLAGVDDVGGRAPKVPRQAIVDLLAQHPTTGLTIAAVAQHFGQTEKSMTLALYMLRKLGQVAAVKHIGRAYYFPSQAAAESQADRFRRERQDVQNEQARRRTAVVKAARKEKAAASRERARVAAPAPAARPEKPTMGAALPPSMRAAPSIATPAKRPVEIITPPSAKITKHETPPELIDRFGAANPAARVEGGFHSEWLALRAGGAQS